MFCLHGRTVSYYYLFIFSDNHIGRLPYWDCIAMVMVLWQNWGEHVGRQLPHFLTAATLTDVTITVGHRSLRAHRIILAFFSPFFKRMLEEVCEERPMVVVFPGVNYDALQVIVAYMYRGQVNVPSELLSHVIELAKMLQVKGLIELPSQLDSVIASANNNECNTNSHLTRTGCAEMCMEGEDGIVELEVTEGEPHPTVSTNTSSFHTNTTTSLQHPTNNRIGLLTKGEDRTSTANIDATTTTTTTTANTNTTTTTTTANTITTSTVSYTTTANTTNTTTTATTANTTTASGHVFIQPEDIQLTTVDDLAPTHIVKLNEDGSMGEMWFGGGYISAPPPPSTSSSTPPHPHRPTAPHADEESLVLQDTQTGGKKERKVIYKLTRYGPEDLQGALEDVRAGAGTLREIAGRWGVPHSTLSVNARLAGIAPQHHRSLDYDPQTLQAAKDAVRSGASYMKVARQYNIPKSVLWRRCQLEAVVSGGVRRGGGGGGYGYAQRDLSVARQRLLDGTSLSHIVKETKIPKTTLFRIKEQLVREGRLPASSITRLPRLRRAPEESLRRAVAACRDQGLTHGQASEKFQVSKSTVWRRLKRLKQETPSTCGDADTTRGDSSTVGSLVGCAGPVVVGGEKGMEEGEQRVKIEVVESLTPEESPLVDTHHHHFQYSSDSVVEQKSQEAANPTTSPTASPKPCGGGGRGMGRAGVVSQEVVVENMEVVVAGTIVDTTTTSTTTEHHPTTDTLDKMDLVIGTPCKVEVDDHTDRMETDRIEVVAREADKIEVVAREVDRIQVVAGQADRIEDVAQEADRMDIVAGRTDRIEVVAREAGDHLSLLQQEEEQEEEEEEEEEEEDGSLTVAREGKVVTEGEEEEGQRFELEMPLVNLPGGEYQVVGSEIVIGGQQVVVIEPSTGTPHLS
ncbi:hypothetical protein Pcinc_004004 [Petrolisthes cinctipes]|uniref:BTB domain-containing protein n=1 Tax=Petrolisthes cinctipes TaxID=88211 RepID=A0AAE1GFZ4_PETCI|nr:hypothetical protein Pcinc_004004 [Petrolisthes cinctipes]